MQRNLHESGASRLTDVLGRQDKMNDGMSVGLNPGSEPALWRNGNLRSLTFASSPGVKVNVNYVIIGLSKNTHLSDRNRNFINQKQRLSKDSTVYY